MKIEVEFKAFFEKYFAVVSRFVQHYVQEEEVVADIAQEAFLKLYERWSEFEQEENAKAFIYTIARNLAYDYLRHQKIKMRYFSDYMEEHEEAEQTFFQEVTRQEASRILHIAINNLPQQTRQIMLYTLAGDSLQMIGEKLGVSINTVKTLKKNAYIALRRLLANENL